MECLLYEYFANKLPAKRKKVQLFLYIFLSFYLYIESIFSCKYKYFRYGTTLHVIVLIISLHASAAGHKPPPEYANSLAFLPPASSSCRPPFSGNSSILPQGVLYYRTLQNKSAPTIITSLTDYVGHFSSLTSLGIRSIRETSRIARSIPR